MKWAFGPLSNKAHRVGLKQLKNKQAVSSAIGPLLSKPYLVNLIFLSTPSFSVRKKFKSEKKRNETNRALAYLFQSQNKKYR